MPFLNILAPVIATAAMVHLFESWRRRDGIHDKPATGADMTLRTTPTDVADV